MCGVVGLEGVCLFVLLFVVLSFFRLVWPPSVLPYNRRQYGMRRSSSLLIAIRASSALTEETCRQSFFFFLRAQCTRLHNSRCPVSSQPKKQGSSAIVPSFLRSFVPSFLRSSVPSFLRSFVPLSFLRSFVPLSFLRSFVPSFLRSSFVPSFVVDSSVRTGAMSFAHHFRLQRFCLPSAPQ